MKKSKDYGKSSRSPKHASIVDRTSTFHNYRNMPKEMNTQWEVSDSTIDHMLDKTMMVLKHKEIAKKSPLYSLVSTVMDMSKTVTLKGIAYD